MSKLFYCTYYVVTYQTSNSDKAPSSPDSRITASNLQPELLSSKDTLDFGLHNQSCPHTTSAGEYMIYVQ